MNNSDTHKPTNPHTPFAPLLLTLIGLLVLLAWNLRVTILQTANLQIAKAQLGQASLQSQQTEAKLQSMLTDLLALAATEKDPDAAAIVKRYGIKQNGPAAAAAKPESRNAKSETNPKSE
jgi:hypothetical protein